MRMGLPTVNVDSPLQADWTNTKHQNARTELGCPACKVKKSDLGNGMFDIKRNARTADRLRRDLEYVAAGATPAERTERSKRRGVVIGAFSNPLNWVFFDRIAQIGMDILHQARA